MSTRVTAITGGVSAWLVRGMLIVSAAFLLWWGQNAFNDYERTLRASFGHGSVGFWGAVILFAASGLGFGLAIRYPFPEPAFAFGRLAFAVLALAPAVHVAYVFALEPPIQESVLNRFFWFDDLAIVQIGAVLAGVAIASGVGARRGR